MGGGLAGRCARLKRTVEGAIANHLQERFVANCSELKDRHSEPRGRHCERSEAIHSPHDGSSYPRRRVSSTPRLIDSITAASGILGHPPSRVTTEYAPAFSRRIAPEICMNLVPQR